MKKLSMAEELGRLVGQLSVILQTSRLCKHSNFEVRLSNKFATLCCVPPGMPVCVMRGCVAGYNQMIACKSWKQNFKKNFLNL